MKMTRRDFAKSLSAAAAVAGVEGCTTRAAVQTPRPDFMWGYLVHFGMNCWADVVLDHWGKHRDSLQCATHSPADRLRVDWEQWEFVTGRMAEVGMNTIVIDMAEGVRWDSHPELAVAGSWTKEAFRRELDRLRALGLEPIPKMNFSTCHDTWLKDYGRMVSTSTYYKVCSDLIREVAELYDHPRYLHLGYDEEGYGNQAQYNFVVIRQGELWWHDMLWFVETTEKAGMRPWIWSDYYRKHSEEFVRRMPRSVLQSNWYYANDFDTKTSAGARAYVELDKAGFDQVPCGSNWATDENFALTVDFCSKNVSRERLKGFLMAPWTRSWNVFRQKDTEALEQVRAARERFHI